MNFATEDSGTSAVGVLLSTLPVEALREPALADTGTEGVVLEAVEAVPVFEAVAVLVVATEVDWLVVPLAATCVVTVWPATTEVRVAGT